MCMCNEYSCKLFFFSLFQFLKTLSTRNSEGFNSGLQSLPFNTLLLDGLKSMPFGTRTLKYYKGISEYLFPAFKLNSPN